MEGIRIHKTQRNQGISKTLVLTGALWILSDHSITIAKYCTGCCMKRLSRNQSCHDRMEPTRWFKSHILVWTTDSCMKEESPCTLTFEFRIGFYSSAGSCFWHPQDHAGKIQGKSPANPTNGRGPWHFDQLLSASSRVTTAPGNRRSHSVIALWRPTNCRFPSPWNNGYNEGRVILDTTHCLW